MGALYILTSPVGKSYIGITSKTTEIRWAKHVEHALGKRESGALYAAMRKYGPNSFAVKTLVISDDWDYLCDLEIKAISAYKTKTPFGYNVSSGGEGNPGPRDDEFKRKVAIAQKKRFERPDQRARMKEIADSIPEDVKAEGRRRQIAVMQSAEFREKASNNAKRQFANPEARRKVSASLKQAMTDLRREEMSARSTALMADPDLRKRVSIATREAMSRPDVAKKVRTAAKERVTSQVWRERISASKTGKSNGPASEQRKERISTARLSEWADPEKRALRLAGLARAREAKALKTLARAHPLLQETLDSDPALAAEIHATKDKEGRIWLALIHRVAGGEERHRPKYFLQTQGAKQLISSLPQTPSPVISFRGAKGTYGNPQVAFAYAKWIDPTSRPTPFNS